MSSKRKRLVVAGCVVAAFAGAGAVAYAEWSGSAAGSGRARATTVVQATLTAANGAPDLFPGFTDGDVYFTVTNPNAFGITYTDMTATTVTSSDETACPASNVTIEPATGLSLVSPPSATSETLSITDVVSMSVDAPDGCQGVSFDIALTLTGDQTG
jgi:hypothetical protein